MAIDKNKWPFDRFWRREFRQRSRVIQLLQMATLSAIAHHNLTQEEARRQTRISAFVTESRVPAVLTLSSRSSGMTSRPNAGSSSVK